MPNDFAAQVSDWVKNSKIAAEAIFHESAQRVIQEMQTTRAEGGNMPVDTGFLRASLIASNDAMPVIRSDAKPAAGSSYSYNAGPVALTINNTSLGGRIYAGFVAAYARFVNYGTSKTPARLFVELAAQRWPEIVRQVEGEFLRQMNSK